MDEKSVIRKLEHAPFSGHPHLSDNAVSTRKSEGGINIRRFGNQQEFTCVFRELERVIA